MTAFHSLLVLLVGASGSGKTTILKGLEQYFPHNNASINYFDSIGVLKFEDMIAQYGSPEKWQQWAVNLWIEKLHSQIDTKQFVILEGSFDPEFAIMVMSRLKINRFLIICIHTERAVRESRLLNQRMQKELATQDMENFAQKIKEKTIALKGIVIENKNELTTTIQEVLHAIMKESLR